MNSRVLWILVLGAAGFGVWQHFSPYWNPPPIPFENPAYQLTPVASHSITGAVLSSKHYRSGEGSAVMPVDLAMAWGPMADPVKYRRLDISQRERFYYWKADAQTLADLGRESIESNTANIHCVPASEEIREALFRIQRDERVTLKGQLVDITGPDRNWSTSRSRNDTGPGACEILLVEEILPE